MNEPARRGNTAAVAEAEEQFNEQMEKRERESLEHETFYERLLAKAMDFWHTQWDVHEVNQDWSWQRQMLAKTFASPLFDVAIGVVVFINVYVLIVETDSSSTLDDNYEPQYSLVPTWCKVVSKLLMVLYALELALRIYTFRWEFFHIPQNVFDFCIIVSDISIDLIMPSLVANLGVLRLFRLARLGRAMKVLTLFPELALMMQGMAGAFRSICWGMILVSFVLMLWSVMAVQLIHPLNRQIAEDGGYGDCERCGRAFESVSSTMVTLTQHIIFGDSWGQVSIPIIERYSWTYLFFVSVMFTVDMGILNLILAVIVDRSLESRKETEEEMVMVKEKKFKNAAKDLEKICRSLDTDLDGVLSSDEIVMGYKNNREFRNAMRLMDVGENDMERVFDILDEDKSGDIAYGEFVDQIYKLKSDDSHTIQSFIKHNVQEILHRTTMLLHHQKFDDIFIALHEIGMCLKSSGMSISDKAVELPQWLLTPHSGHHEMGGHTGLGVHGKASSEKVAAIPEMLNAEQEKVLEPKLREQEFAPSMNGAASDMCEATGQADEGPTSLRSARRRPSASSLPPRMASDDGWAQSSPSNSNARPPDAAQARANERLLMVEIPAPQLQQAVELSVAGGQSARGRKPSARRRSGDPGPPPSSEELQGASQWRMCGPPNDGRANMAYGRPDTGGVEPPRSLM